MALGLGYCYRRCSRNAPPEARPIHHFVSKSLNSYNVRCVSRAGFQLGHGSCPRNCVWCCSSVSSAGRRLHPRRALVSSVWSLDGGGGCRARTLAAARRAAMAAACADLRRHPSPGWRHRRPDPPVSRRRGDVNVFRLTIGMWLAWCALGAHHPVRTARSRLIWIWGVRARRRLLIAASYTFIAP